MYNGKALKPADPSTIQDKLLVGYQGWFTCGGDGEPVGRGHHGWLHWFDYPVPDGGRPNTDIWPDVSEYDPSELYEAPGLKTRSGEKCYLFSSRNQKTVDRHFNWMAQHGIDGAFLQRFASQCDGRAENDGIRKIRDEVGDRVQEAAEKNGRAYAIMYDVSGVPPDKIEGIIKHDWKQLVFNKRIFDSPSYLREKGKPVVALWGFGFEGSHHTPGLVRSIASYINSSHPGGVYLMAGVPAHWRTSTGDADRNPEFVEVWLDCFDAISPWTIGRYGNIADADKFAEEKIAGDMKLISERNRTVRLERRLDYIPVVLPGGSGYNLSEGKWGFNAIPREGGRFLWRQIYNARRNGARTIYGAMWDEYDEGTAFMPIVTNKNQLPLPVRDKYRFLAPDADTQDLPSDWYMRICGLAAEVLRGDRRLLETFPHKELQDYWGTRPRYQDGTSGGYVPANSKSKASGSGSLNILASEENPNEPPPPPYTMEEKSPSSAHEGFSTAPTSPNDQKNYKVSDLANDLGRHTIGGPSPHSPSHPQIPGGFGSQPTSPLHAIKVSPTTVPPSPFLANKPPSPSLATKPTPPPQSTTPLTTPPLSSPFPHPFGPSQDFGVPSIPMPQVPNLHQHPVNPNTPFHWNDDYNHNLQSQPPDGYNTYASTNPWDAPAPTKPQEAPFQQGYQPSYGSPPPPPQHTRPPVHAATKPKLSPQSPHESYPPSQSTYPGQVQPGPYNGYDQQKDGKGKDVWGGPPPSNSLYPGPPTSGQETSPYAGAGFTPQSSYPVLTNSGPSPLAQGHGQYQSSYPGMTSYSPAPGVDRPPPTHPAKSHSGPPVSNTPPLSQGPGGYGQHQSSYYPVMTSSPAPMVPERPPTGPPTSGSPPLSQGYGQHQSSYPGMTNSPAPDRPTMPYRQATVPSQAQPPPLPGGYIYSDPTQSTYGGINPGVSPLPAGPGSYGYQQQQQQPTYPGYNPPPPSTSPYPGYPESHQPPPLPPHQQGGLPSGPSSSGGPSFNQTPHQYPFLPGQQPAQGSGGNATGLSYSVPWSNATVPWKKQQVDIKNIAKGTMNKLTGSMKNKQGASLYKPNAMDLIM